MESAFRGTCPDDLKVIETCLSKAGTGITLWPFHQARLTRTCDRLGIVPDLDAVLRGIAKVPKDSDRRVRLTVALDGTIAVESPELQPSAAEWRLQYAAEVLVASDPWRGVKTTHRGLYDRARAALQEGVQEAIFLNDKGRVAEGTITNVFVQNDGRLLTPPITSGALPGVLRASLIETGQAQEADLGPDDLKGAKLFVGNALRGLIPAKFV